jgi:hypothetical protein
MTVLNPGRGGGEIEIWRLSKVGGFRRTLLQDDIEDNARLDVGRMWTDFLKRVTIPRPALFLIFIVGYYFE